MKKDTPQTFTNSIGDFVIRTTQIDKKKFDLQTAKFVYGTNTLFRHVQHPEFVKLVNKLRPGYKLPNRHNISNNLLDEVFNTTIKR